MAIFIVRVPNWVHAKAIELRSVKNHAWIDVDVSAADGLVAIAQRIRVLAD
jgi:hypothetical protein